MKQAIVNGRWNLWLPDNVADWDGITGDFSAGHGWEFARFKSMQERLAYGHFLYDVGAEHGWISAVLAREFVGAENMVLFEPSPDFWVNIHKTWEYNGLRMPAVMWPGFVGETNQGVTPGNSSAKALSQWPKGSGLDRPECEAMAYRSLANPAEIPTITIDRAMERTGRHPYALNIDVEGAELLVLRGAEKVLSDPFGRLHSVWVSIHEDLMVPFGHTPDDVHKFMRDAGWLGQYLGTDHEAHWLYTREPF